MPSHRLSAYRESTGGAGDNHQSDRAKFDHSSLAPHNYLPQRDMHPDLAQLIDTAPKRLSYSIHSASGYVSPFPPEKILVDCPSDDASRWTTPTPDARKKERQQFEKSLAAGSANGSPKPPLEQGESEWIMIELDQVSLVQSVGFGKAVKAHPCNLAEFSIFGGLSPDPASMERLLDGLLKNDTNTQKFRLQIGLAREGKEQAPLPIKYIRIECHEAVNVTYSIAIWHLFLEGSTLTPPLDTIAIDSLAHHEEATTAHLILAHLRRSGPQTLPAFTSYLSTLPSSISSTFEHSSLSKLHEALVIEGDFDKTELVLEECLRENLFREWSPSSTSRRKGTTIAKWERLDTLFPSGTLRPGPRGGHQMVRVGRKLLLFGGWDGKKDLGDLWEWELPRDNITGGGGGGGDGGWRYLSTGEEEGTGDERPGKRSCHQLAVDESEGWVYLLGARRDEDSAEDWEGRTEESDRGRNGGDEMEIEGDGTGLTNRVPSRSPHEDNWSSDFWRYRAVGPGRGKWELLSRDTRNDGGPALLFDHAMVVHSATQRLFVFGGKWQPYEGGDVEESNGGPATSAPTSQYSGMYCYDINTRKWTHLFGDPTSASTPASFLTDRLVPRAGHSMVLDAAARNATIYIYGGQRDTRYENDLWAVRLATPRSTDGSNEDDEELPEGGDEDRLWRQGAVLDAPRRAVARSLIDTSLLPVSPESSPSRNSSVPTIVQIRRIEHKNASSSVPPPAAFTPRLSLTANRSLTLLTGLTRTGSGSSMQEVPLEGIWRKSPSETGPWQKIEEWSAGNEERRPSSRFASQVVYDPLRNEHYVFGGHPHDAANPDTRLADFWKLRIIDPTPEEALRMSKFLVRKQRFNEMCTSVPTVFALQYLQNDLSSVVDHSSPSESTAFRSCMTALLSAPPQHNVDVPLDGSGELPRLDSSKKEQETYRERHRLFEELMEFFPMGERQPVEQLDQFSRMLRSKGTK
ncbi:uncharacterized protein JCM6883_000764 [Sporobolomyces salmoneus]|uniref:uncharacterized protein n=1 Tax=Sporobolomyces salmoneus TaxID=183962 RepID=UPI00317D67AB